MKENRGSIAASILALAMGDARASHADADSKLVKFPADYPQGVHYATIERGNIREEIFASKVMIDAVKSGHPFQAPPSLRASTIETALSTDTW